MVRGTTPTHTFNVDIDLSDAQSVYITYKQLSRVIVEKSKADITISSDALVCELTQKETLAFSSKYPVLIQIRAKFEGGSAVASNIIETTAEAILKGGEI